MLQVIASVITIPICYSMVLVYNTLAMTHGMAKRPLTSLAITHGMEIFLQEGLRCLTRGA